MRILYVLERYPELSQTFVEREIEAVSSLGHEVRVVALAEGQAGDRSAPAVLASDAGIARRASDASLALLSNPSSALRQLTSEPNWPPPGGSARARGFLRIAPFIREAGSVDHIHAHFATEAADIARLIASASGRPWSFTAHGRDAYSDPATLALNLESASFARGGSDHVCERLRNAAGPTSCPVVEIPVAVDLDRFRRDGPYAPEGPIVSVGRLVEKKGFDDLIHAFAALPPALADRGLVIVGDGPLRSELERLASSLGANVTLTGAIDNDMIPPILWRSSLFALTPKVAEDGDRDGRPASIVEAMAASLPVLSTSLPGIPGLVTPNCGVLAPVDDPAALAETLSRILLLPSRDRARFGSAGALAVENHAPARVASELLSWIGRTTESVVRSPEPGR